jgi:hypothetical protein
MSPPKGKAHPETLSAPIQSQLREDTASPVPVKQKKEPRGMLIIRAIRFLRHGSLDLGAYLLLRAGFSDKEARREIRAYAHPRPTHAELSEAMDIAHNLQ